MTTQEHLARCELEIQKCRIAAQLATADSDRYGHTWAEVDWMVAKQMYEEVLASEMAGTSQVDLMEVSLGLCSGSKRTV